MRFLLAALAMCLITNSGHAQWGHLKGRILLDGYLPEPKLLIKGPAPRMPGVADIPDESLVINAKSKGIANVAVFLMAKKDLKIHPDRAKSAAPAVTVNLTQGRFSPRLALVRTDQTLKYVNLDGVPYNVRGTPLKNEGYNPLVGPNATSAPIKFTVGERHPFQIRCDLYNWMQGYTIIVDHPYATLTDKDGNFEIKDLPAGEHEFKVWHERATSLVRDADSPKKVLTVEIQAGHTLEVDGIKVPLETFK